MDRPLVRAALTTVLALGLAAEGSSVDAPDLGLLQEQNRIKSESERKIQEDILDPILGKGAAMPFVDVEMEIKVEKEQSTRSGMGLAEKYREKLGGGQRSGLQTTYVMPGIPTPKTISAGDRAGQKPEAAQAQQAQQLKGVQEERFALKPVFKKLGVTIIHDDAVLDPQKDAAQVTLVRERIVDAMSQYGLQQDQIAFRPTRFKKLQIDWRDDLKKPSVYLPLLYALLTALFLLFLFGPLWRFMRAYVDALTKKPGAEVNIEDKREEGGGGGDGDGDQTQKIEQEARLAITLQRRPPEEPPPPEDEEMKKFEPFAYINEENVKRLAYMFILRKEEPWVVAVVASYLKPQLARQMLTLLPIELQARVAVEALTVRQVTRDQVVAIDADVKENVDFVVGGVERLTSLLDEADTATRNNILNYLKNEKPLVYEHVRRYILVFDDVVRFSDRDMQIVVRELKTETMARALTNATPEVVQKFFSNMSVGAASLLKESMEYAGNLNEIQIDEERARIMEVVKTLDREGKIKVRQVHDNGGYDLVEGMQEELAAMERRRERFAAARRKADALAGGAASAAPAPAPAPAADPAQAQQYFQAGVAQHDAGQMDAAVQYLQAAVQLDSSLWQAHQYLGNALYALGRVGEAVASFERVLQFNPDPNLRQWVEGLKTQASR